MLFDCIISQLIVKGLRKPTRISLVLMNSFLKSPRPSLPLKRAPPLSPSPFPLRGQGMCQPPYSVLKPLRYKVGGPSEVSPAAELRFAVCDRMDTNRLRAAWCLLEVCLKLAWCLLKVFSKTHLDFLSLNEGFFRKPTSPPLPLREGPPLISVFSPQGRRGNRSSSSLVTISFYGWRTIRGLASSGAAVFCAGINPLSLKDLLRSCLVDA